MACHQPEGYCAAASQRQFLSYMQARITLKALISPSGLDTVLLES
jgi:hypothetical protein